MTLSVLTGAALTGRPIIGKKISKKGGHDMTEDTLDTPVDTGKRKAAAPPHQLKNRVRICGRWQKKGYRPSAEEVAKWKEHCKDTGKDPRTGRLLLEKTATKK